RLHLHQTLKKTPHVNITAHQEELATAIQPAGQYFAESHTSISTSQIQPVKQLPVGLQAITDTTSGIEAERVMDSPPETVNPTPSPTEITTTAPRRSRRIKNPPVRYTLPE